MSELNEFRILVVDDNPAIHQDFKKILVNHEFRATDAQLAELIDGVTLKDGPARAVSASLIESPENLWERDPPIRYRASVPNSWIEISISEGRNRQVRRMTAAVGLPTLRLIRIAVGPWSLDELLPGESRTISNPEAWTQLA